MVRKTDLSAGAEEREVEMQSQDLDAIVISDVKSLAPPAAAVKLPTQPEKLMFTDETLPPGWTR